MNKPIICGGETADILLRNGIKALEPTQAVISTNKADDIRNGEAKCLETATERGADYVVFSHFFESGLKNKWVVRATLYKLTEPGRRKLELEKARKLGELAQKENACFFGSVCPGSHEYTEEGFQAAQANEVDKLHLARSIRQINRFLAIPDGTGLNPAWIVRLEEIDAKVEAAMAPK